MRTTKTTKLIALIISLLMMITVIPVSVTAQDATSGTILDVAKTDGNGNYYLDGNVTVTETETTEFIGTFDGRGYTVTTSVPLFNSVNNATIENLTVTAEQAIVERAAVVKYIFGNTTFRNVTNNANVNGAGLSMTGDYSDAVTSTDTIVGGIAACILGSTSDGTIVTFENCKNTGAVTADATSGTVSVGGILGGAAFHSTFGNGDVTKKVNIEFKKCVNTGNIGKKGNVGGIVGQPYRSGTVTLDSCVNTNMGTITGTNVAGMVGGSHAVTNILNCVNNGAISGETAAGMIGTARDVTTIISCGNSGAIEGTAGAAGIHAISGNNNVDVMLYYCYNTATITSSGDGAGISERFNTANSVMIGCYNSGLITGTGNYLRQLSHGQVFKTRENNYYTGNKGVIVYTAQNNWTTETTDGATKFDAADLTSGALALAMNTAIGKTVYYQNINTKGATNDAHPVTDPTHGYVFDEDMDKELENGETLYSLAFFTLDGAGIRLDPVNHGIRFSTAVNKADYGVLTEAGITLDFGTIITPDEYLAAAGNDFTALAEGKYLDVNSEATGIGVFRQVKGEDNDTYYFFCGSITGIKAANYDWDYSAIGYVKIDNKKVYSGGYATRNISFIANAAYNDRQDVQTGLYTNAIAADSEYAINGVASYSPYTTDELNIIRGYLQ